jgi:hypothetical protein
MLVGANVQEGPACETVLASVTVPVNPPIGATVTVDFAAVPAFTVTLVGLALRLKSTFATVTVTLVECDSEPLAPVMVTV